MRIASQNIAFRAIVLASLICVAALAAFSTNESREAPISPGAGIKAPTDHAVTKSLLGKTAEDPPSFWTAVLAGLTLVLAGVGVAQVFFLNRADETAKKSADAALKSAIAAERSAQVARDTLISSNRAWIQGRLVIGDQPLQFSDNGLNFAIGFNLQNTGNAPALNISFKAWLIGHRRDRAISVADRHRELCRRARDETPFLDFSMFPGQSFPESAGFSNMQVAAAMSLEEMEACIFRHQPAGHVILLHIGGCVNYSFPASPGEIHQTSFLYELNRTSMPRAILVELGDIPARELHLSGMPTSDGRHAD